MFNGRFANIDYMAGQQRFAPVPQRPNTGQRGSAPGHRGPFTARQISAPVQTGFTPRQPGPAPGQPGPAPGQPGHVPRQPEPVPGQPGPAPGQPVPGRGPGQPEVPAQKAADKTKQTLKAMKEMGSTDVPGVESNVHCLTIVGQVEGHMVLPPQNKTTKYEHILPQMVAIEQNPKIEGVLVILNTVGGDVEAGLSIAEMIASFSKPTVSVVLGGGHSIGVPILP